MINTEETNEGVNLNKRQRQILNLVQKRGFVSIEELAQDFSVTPQTVRRDINELCDQDLLRRFHGGAGISSSVENVSYNNRQIMHHQEKVQIAKAVSELIPNNASIVINIGTTTEEVAKQLMDHKGLRIITNNLNVASILGANPDFEVIIAGGVVRSRDRGIIGEATVDFIDQFKADFGIIGISGIDADGTLLDYDYREVRVAQSIIKNARKIFLAADHSKFERSAMVRLGHISEVDTLFTDQAPPKSFQKILKESDAKVVVAKASV